MSVCVSLRLCKVVKWASPWPRSVSNGCFCFILFCYLNISFDDVNSLKYEWFGKCFNNNYRESLVFRCFFIISLTFSKKIHCDFVVFYLRFIVNVTETKIRHLETGMNLFKHYNNTNNSVQLTCSYGKQKFEKLHSKEERKKSFTIGNLTNVYTCHSKFFQFVINKWRFKRLTNRMGKPLGVSTLLLSYTSFDVFNVFE